MLIANEAREIYKQAVDDDFIAKYPDAMKLLAVIEGKIRNAAASGSDITHVVVETPKIANWVEEKMHQAGFGCYVRHRWEHENDVSLVISWNFSPRGR